MMLKSVRCRVVQWWLVAAILIALIAVPVTPPVLAGDCVSSSSCTSSG